MRVPVHDPHRLIRQMRQHAVQFSVQQQRPLEHVLYVPAPVGSLRLTVAGYVTPRSDSHCAQVHPVINVEAGKPLPVVPAPNYPHMHD